MMLDTGSEKWRGFQPKMEENSERMETKYPLEEFVRKAIRSVKEGKISNYEHVFHDLV